MSDSLRDQLLKAGLADAKQAKKAQHEQRQRRREQNQRGKKAPVEKTEAQKLAEAAAQAERERSRTLNAEQAAARERKALKAQLREVVAKHELKTGTGDIGFNFPHEGKIKRLYVNKEQHAQLGRGHLAIAQFERRYRLLPKAAAEKLRALAPDLFVFRAEPPAEDDAYADHPVPDDLMW